MSHESWILQQQIFRSKIVIRRALHCSLVFASVLVSLRALVVVIVFACALHSCVCQSSAQESAQETDEDEKSNSAVTESSLETFYLRSKKDGKLIPYFKIPFEEFDELYQLYQGGKASRPDREYSLENLDVSGKVVDDFAELKIDIEVLSLVDGWSSVPLRLDGLILDKTNSELDPDDYFITAESGAGYRLWIKSKSDATTKFSLSGFRAVKSSSGMSQLKLNLPDSPYSQLRIDVPGTLEDAEVSANSILEKPVVANGATQLSVRGPKGDFELKWRGKSDTSAQLAPSVFSKATIVARVEGVDNMRLQAEFDVEAFGSSLEHVDVRLPPGVELIPIDQANISVSILKNETADQTTKQTNPTAKKPDEEKNPQPGNIARVKFSRATKNPAPFSLVGNLKLNDGENFRMNGFEVLGAIRQIGSIEVEAEQKWAIVQTSSDIDRMPTSAAELGAQPIYARYEFDRQPFDLRLRVTQTPSRSKIEPVHEAQIDSESVRLTTRLACSFEGLAPEVLKVDTTGWKVEFVGPRTLVESYTFDENDPSSLNIRLTDYSRQPFRDPQIELILTRDATQADDRSKVEFELPNPDSTTVEPAVLVVYSHDNVELRVASDELLGLAPIDPPSEFEATTGNRTPLAFRRLTPTDKTRFAAEIVVQSRSIDAVSELNIATPRTRIPGRLPKRILARNSVTLNLRFESVNKLFLRVPRAKQIVSTGTPYADPENENNVVASIDQDLVTLKESTKLDVRIDTEPVEYTLRSDLSDEESLVLELNLKSRLLGEHHFDIRYELPAPDSRYPEPIPYKVWLPELLVPNSESASEKNLEPVVCRLGSITTANDQSVGALLQPSPDLWAAESESTEEIDSVPHTFLPDQDFSKRVVNFLWEPIRQDGQLSQIADKLFLQTILMRETRYERLAFRIESRTKPLSVTLPVNSELKSAHLNGVNAKLSNGAIEFDISDRSVPEHVIDIVYEMPQSSERSRYVSCKIPTIEDVSSTRELYWELVMPKDEFFVGAQSSLTPMLRVRWQDGWFLSRSASMDHSLLEQWVGVPSRSQMPPDQACNRYLFSSFGPIQRHQVVVVNRREIVLFAAFLVLLIGLVVTIFPRVRHPMNLLALIVAVAVAFLRYPDLMLTFVQVAAVTILAGTLIYLIQLAFRAKRGSFRRVYWQDDETGETNLLSESEIFANGMSRPHDVSSLDTTFSMPSQTSSVLRHGSGHSEGGSSVRTHE